MHLVPAPAVRLMKSRVLSRPGVNSLVHKLNFQTPNVPGCQETFRMAARCFGRRGILVSIVCPGPVC